MKARSVRVCAALALADIVHGGHSLSSVLPRSSAELSDKDQALLQELCFGVCRYYQRLTAIAQQFLQKPFKRKDADIEALVYLGIYQLLFTRIPDHAAISATVEAAAHLQKIWAKGMLNGVLRNVQRAAATLDQQPWANQATYVFSHPQWFIDKVQIAWPQAWQSLLQANNEHPPLTLRVNQRQQDRDAYLQTLRQMTIDAHATNYSSAGIQLQQACAVQQLPGFAAGALSVQDESAQLAAPLMALAPGQRVLDACCAPGGKTCHILEREPLVRELLALDLEATRMERVRDNLQRLKLNATLTVADANDLDAWWDKIPFDRILLDAPCSATGVIRRHPDIKLLRRVSDIDKLARLQRQMLTTLWQTLAPGGLLVYATCSVLPEENEEVLLAFLQQTEDAEQQAIDADWGQARPVGRQILPQSGGGDGFYYALLRKKMS